MAVDANQINIQPQTYRGTWSATTRYVPGDIVLDNGGNTYICITANTNEDASASSTGNWQVYNPLVTGSSAAFLANLGNSATGTEIATFVNAIRDALVSAGIMKAS